MTVGISLEELLAWSDDAAGSWHEHLDINPSLLRVKCDIGGAGSVQDFVRHIWLAELRWAQRLAGLPVLNKEDAPTGPLEALFNLHREAMEVFRNLLAAPEQSWEQVYVLDLNWIPDDQRRPTRRKVAAHALFHSQRHYAQLATLVRQSGIAVRVGGDLLFSPALR